MYKKIIPLILVILLSTAFFWTNRSPVADNPRIVNITKGWASNSINAVIFRHNSVVTFKDHQYVSFYDADGNVILAKRKLGSEDWKIHKTKFSANVKDAHNDISIMVDGDGYLHMSWGQHGVPLRYCRSSKPGGLELTDEMPMTGSTEQNVTYPEFYRLPDGNLIFLYRDGSSGNGNLVINYYDTKNKTWTNLHQNLIDGEGKRNAYWQATVDTKGTIHISWVWRETWDVATNHDICYAKSTDGGKTWIKSTGEKYQLPINAETAEYVAKIPQNSELINQTSMCTDDKGRPYIASYWTPEESKIPQYHLVYFDGKNWQTKQITKRTSPFSLSGGGTKRIPISRPQIMVDKNETVYLIFRDAERNDRVSAAICNDIKKNEWHIKDLTSFSVGQWEPTYDTELWKSENKLNLFVQYVGQGDAESLDKLKPQMVSILEWTPGK